MTGVSCWWWMAHHLWHTYGSVMGHWIRWYFDEKSHKNRDHHPVSIPRHTDPMIFFSQEGESQEMSRIFIPFDKKPRFFSWIFRIMKIYIYISYIYIYIYHIYIYILGMIFSESPLGTPYEIMEIRTSDPRETSWDCAPPSHRLVYTSPLTMIIRITNHHSCWSYTLRD